VKVLPAPSSLSVAIAYRAIQNGFEARFVTADEMIGELSHAALAGRLEEALEPTCTRMSS
jgi:DNA replication protein DnaC